MRRRIRYSRNESGWLALVPLPLGFGLNVGPGFTGYISLRSWSWARYDHADHMGEQTRWSTQVLSNPRPIDIMVAASWERYTTQRLRRRNIARILNR
jgi:hypothetical protein